MATKERNQNPVIGDDVNLRLFFYNSNEFASVYNISQVNIYSLENSAISCTNLEGRVLIETIPGTNVSNPQTGEYLLDLYLNPLLYTTTGRYVDVWEVLLQSTDTVPTTFEQLFTIYPDLWYASPIPIVYDFSFYFQPNKIRYGSKIFLTIDVITNVPRATDLQAYYTNLAQAGVLKVFMSNHCDPCNPCGSDNMVIDGEVTPFVDKNRAFYQIDTTLYDCGLFDVWFELTFGSNIYVSPKNQLLIFN